MVTNFVEQQSARATRNLLILSALLVAGSLTALLFSTRFLYNVISGPFDINPESLLGLSDAGNLQQYFVTVKGEKSLDTGIDEVVSRTRSSGVGTANSEKLAAHYLALVVGNRVLLVRTPNDTKLAQFTGILQPMPSDVQQEVIDYMVKEVPDLNGVFLPFLLNVEDIRGSGYIELAVGAALLLLATWNLTRIIRRTVSPDTQPIYKALGAYGPAQAVVGAIDAEVNGPGCAKVGGAIITPHWLLRASLLNIQVTSLDDLVWAYQKTIEHRSYMIKTGETHVAVFWTRQGKCLEITGKQADISSMLVQVVYRAPWVLTGFTKERDKAWRTNRQFVIQTVQDRQRNMKMHESMGLT